MVARLFIAVMLPEDVRDVVAAAQAEWRARVRAPVRWVRPELVHLTMQFLGEVVAERSDAAVEAMRRSASGLAPFPVTLRELGALPDAAQARVLVMTLGDGAAQPLATLQRRLRRELAERQFAVDERRFTPHLTLGRLREPRAVATSWYRLRLFSWTVEAFSLVASRLHPSGPEYRTVARVPFT
jgi:2'-5' RNA ligase